LEKKSIFNANVTIQKNNWLEVFSACLGKVRANQVMCSELVVKGQNWNADLAGGTISFGNDQYQVQYLGNESESKGTWLWGWENINNIPQNVITLAEEMKCLGDSLGLEELTTAEIEISEILNGHTFATVVCGLSDKNICYYRGPHQNGAVFLAFSVTDSKVFQAIDAKTFMDVAMGCIQEAGVNHKIFIESFLYQNDTRFEWQGNSIIAHFKQDLKIEFECVDSNWRIINIKTVLES